MISERKVDEKSYKANADDWARKKKRARQGISG